MRRDKKFAQKKKARDLARRGARASVPPTGRAALLRLARASKFGPAYMSGEWRDDTLPARLVSVVITRALPDGHYLAYAMLVDRTCLGVKNAFSLGPLSSSDLAEFVERVGAAHDEDLELVDITVAQSVVCNALAYAASLGFEPHRDFDSAMLEPLPPVLASTPLGRPKRPFYVPGPDDDVARIISKLHAAVGEGGFDLDDHVQPEPAPDESRLAEAIKTWLDTVRDDDRFDPRVAFDEYTHAVMGEAPRAGAEIDAEHVTSLPVLWAALFRPLPGGRTGLELARESKAMDRFHDEFDGLARARATLFDVLGVERDRGVAVCRDVFDGALLDVRMTPAMLSKITRWTRFFGYITPMADGTWYPPSTLLGHVWLRNVAPGDVVGRVNHFLAEIGVSERLNPTDPFTGLTRFGALAHGVVHRSIAPTEEQAADLVRPFYCVNSDEERFEFHEAVVRLDATHARDLIMAMSSADDFVKDAGFGWMREPRVHVLEHERLASVTPNDDGSFRVTANSAPRFEKLLVRLSSLAGTQIEPSDLKVMRPWEHNERAVAEEVPNCHKVVMGAKVLETAAPLDVGDLILESARRALDEVVPALGARPRDLVKNAEGSRLVEQWISDQELRGTPGEAGIAFLDLDELRRGLGLRPVLEISR